jgi:hypothetical protein
MIRAITTLILGVSWLGAAPAVADTFESAAQGARAMRQLDELVWSLTSACERATDVEQRQCRVIRDARAQVLTATPLLVDAEPGALELGAWNGATKSVAIKLSSCIACTGAVIDGRTWYVTGAPPRVVGGKLETAALFDNARPFADAAAATTWIAAFNDARVQLLVKVPEKRRWHVSGKDGLQLEILGYRVYSPCTGAVLLANPTASGVQPDKRACAAGDATGTPASGSR